MIRVLGTVVNPDSEATVLSFLISKRLSPLSQLQDGSQARIVVFQN
jgi:hypothetical protein